MANLTINGTSYSPITSGFTSATKELVAGTYYAVGGQYGEPPRIASPEQEEMIVTFVGVDGVGSKQAGYRGQNITCDIVIAGANKTATEGSLETLLNSMPTNVRFDVTPPGGAVIHGCKLVRGSGRPSRWFTIGNQICCALTLDLRSWSTSN